MIDFFFDSDLVGDISNLPLLSYLLVELRPGVDPVRVAAAIEEVEPAGDVFTPAQLARNDMALGRTLFGPVMGVLIGVCDRFVGRGHDHVRSGTCPATQLWGPEGFGLSQS